MDTPTIIAVASLAVAVAGAVFGFQQAIANRRMAQVASAPQVIATMSLRNVGDTRAAFVELTNYSEVVAAVRVAVDVVLRVRAASERAPRRYRFEYLVLRPRATIREDLCGPRDGAPELPLLELLEHYYEVSLLVHYWDIGSQKFSQEITISTADILAQPAQWAGPEQ